MDQLPFAVGDCLSRGVFTKLLLVPIIKGIRELHHTIVSDEQTIEELIRAYLREVGTMVSCMRTWLTANVF